MAYLGLRKPGSLAMGFAYTRLLEEASVGPFERGPDPSFMSASALPNRPELNDDARNSVSQYPPEFCLGVISLQTIPQPIRGVFAAQCFLPSDFGAASTQTTRK